MNKRELRKKCMEHIIKNMYYVPQKSTKLYGSLTKFVTSIIDREGENVEYILFVLSSLDEEMNKPYYNNKINTMSPFSRLAYIKAVLDGLLVSKKDSYVKNQSRFVVDITDCNSYGLVMEHADVNVGGVDISRFLD